VSPAPRLAWLLAALSLSALVLPAGVVVLLGLALAAVAVTDLLAVRGAPRVARAAPRVLARGVRSPLTVDVEARGPARVRQPVPPDQAQVPSEADGRLEATLLPRRRGRHLLPAPAVRVRGRLGLAGVTSRAGEDAEVLVYPDLPAAYRLVAAVRQGRFRDAGLLTRGPLGLGTDFESIRDYLPDDDIRQVNWRASARVGRPMSNQYRVEQDRNVICCIDAGRLMAAPVGENATRLDVALDAAVAVALVADEVGDQCGAVAFADTVLRRVLPRRRGGRAVVEALFDLEPTPVEADYEAAFRRVGGGKRSLVLVFTDLLEETAARPLVEAVPVLTRRHHVVVASVRDPDLDALVRTPPTQVADVLAAAVVVDALDARERVAAQLRRAGAEVLEAPASGLAAACVAVYLRAKARALL
jgi:uncharacterized protein (DUF58 family)